MRLMTEEICVNV